MSATISISCLFNATFTQYLFNIFDTWGRFRIILREIKPQNRKRIANFPSAVFQTCWTSMLLHVIHELRSFFSWIASSGTRDSNTTVFGQPAFYERLGWSADPVATLGIINPNTRTDFRDASDSGSTFVCLMCDLDSGGWSRRQVSNADSPTNFRH